MSFNHLSTLESQSSYHDDPLFSSLTSSLSSRLFTLTSNITQLNRHLSLLGTKKDTSAVRSHITSLLDSTRDGFRDVTDGVKRVKNWQDPSPQMKFTQRKLESQLTAALAEFQSVQRLSMEKNRQYVAATKRLIHEEDPERYTDESSGGEVQVALVHQQTQAAALAGQEEVEFQESLIIQREEEIRDIERGITELNDIFRDLGTMVTAQGESLDVVENNVAGVRQDHKAADLELRRAAKYQRNARNRMCVLLLILGVVLTVVLLAIFLG
ncbi:Similar to Syntaxin-7; acc. no. Q3ZBT5 [Pyronema omphalodes CBS 100304]|uniref:Similar to Syntaxin-7 acc. no. Q3ZBT5 n=1 Tax=Pyronema omphalodes (strain CBS 100304) TaxID=1076935 RepID=U4LAQ1_PYROM|nr:Similar to Syntaxin-7; acc. no. Q3ZBT5 [Pyronema omphalodes CBS 100304]